MQSNQNQKILSLEKQIRKYKQQAQYWRNKYFSLEKEHNTLIQCLKLKPSIEKQLANSKISQQTSFLRTDSIKFNQEPIQYVQNQQNPAQEILQETINSKFQSSKLFDFNVNSVDRKHQQYPLQFPKIGIFSQKVEPHPTSLPKQKLESIIEPQEQSPGRLQWTQSKTEQIDHQIDFFSIEQIQKHTSIDQNGFGKFDQNQQNQDLPTHRKQSNKKGLNLVQGYFILQKINQFNDNLKSYDLWIKDANSSLIEKQKNLLEIVYRYSFKQQTLIPIEDDPFDSRMNQIQYGTPYEDLLYSFDNFQMDSASEQEQQCKFIKKSMRKKFIHCLIRPEIIYLDQKPFQTQIIYGFISPFPFKTFFQDIHRTLQQQIKFQLFKSKKNVQEEIQVSKDNRIEVISVLMRNLFEYCEKNCSGIQNYPIKLVIQTKVSVLKLDIESQQDLKKIERENLQTLVKKYNLAKISKILHYILVEKQLVVVGATRKSLNQIHEIIRLMIKPFYWVFPVVYRYTDHFQPFLSSPMPLIIGMVFDFNNLNYKENHTIKENDFVTIFAEQKAPQKDSFFFSSVNKAKYFPNDLRQVEVYQKDIDFLTKYLNKDNKKSNSNTSERIYKYVCKLRNFIQTGKIDSELSNFLIDFMDTQMVQYYKDVLMGSNKKIQDLKMTK